MRVRELGADTTRMPGMAGPRSGLDTTLSIDSVFAVWIRPGGASLLEITYRIPEEDLFGILAYNNGHKIVFDGQRFHAVYARFEGNKNDSTSSEDRIYYACSYPVSGVEDQIRWNPIDVAVSFDDIMPDSVRRRNRTPSVTVDFSGEDTAAVVTWTCHPLDTIAYAGMREVVTRRVRIWDPDGMGANKELGPITTVAYHDGSYLGLYGTPVVSRLDGGIMVAWSDSTAGIQARFQKRPNGMWWTKQPQQSAAVTVSSPLPGGYADAWFPSMPPFAQVAAGDSNVAITWQQLNPKGTGNNIWYRRLEHFQQPGVGPAIRLYPTIRLNTSAGPWAHPSIDQWQCWWWQAYEGVVWEDMTPNRHAIVYRPVSTETYDPRGWDSIHTSYAWIPLTVRMAPVGAMYSTIGPGWPTIASLNEVIDAESGDDTTFFALAVGDSINAATLTASRLLQMQIWFGNSVLRSGYPKTYLYSGYFPQLASSIMRQDLNSATLYQSSRELLGTPTPTIRPTQQFFGRTRSVGGIATGRQATVRLNDSLETEFSVEFSDPWFSSENSSAMVPMVSGPDSTTTIDSLSRAEDFLRTTPFSVHDSVTIGATIIAHFSGDSTAALGYYLQGVLELVDTVNDEVVAVLDSFYVTNALDSHEIVIESDLDLVSSVYDLRLKLTTNVNIPTSDSGVSRVPMGEVVVLVPDDEGSFARIRRTSLASGGSTFRIAIAPNPSSSITEARFSVAVPSFVSLRLTDDVGRVVQSVVERQYMEPGRYAVRIDLRTLPSGMYYLEAASGTHIEAAQILLAR
jgi:hypothetical protein